MKKGFSIVVVYILLAGLIWAGVFAWKNLRGIVPALKKPPVDITQIINTTGMPLKLPPGYSIEIFAKDLPGARDILIDSSGNMWVSQTSQGKIALLYIQNGKVVEADHPLLLQGLKNPHGLAIDPENNFSLYFAEEDKISKTCIYCDGQPETVIDLPSGGNHKTRTIGFGSDGRLYVSIGSSCNVCNKKNERRASILSMNKDGSNAKIFAAGLRNSVFFTWHPTTKKMWATDMGRDLLGDDLPPDEINIVEEDKNYGWPICYGKNIHDLDFDKNTYVRAPCQEPFEMPSFIDIPAHSAPLGLAFFENDLLVSYHGSWNRSEPTGYKVVRYKLDEQGNPKGALDFITGWLTKDGALGRPVDIFVAADNTIYISDDKAGVIYQIKKL
ncbi:PQQ-dependent sugar dehydrogenase [Candidatus Peregrinibacteria bacterium]|nr:PQQ-dependent sugar dehydrogenase [Candidatus Peregrinibacteria bacterium]